MARHLALGKRNRHSQIMRDVRVRISGETNRQEGLKKQIKQLQAEAEQQLQAGEKQVRDVAFRWQQIAQDRLEQMEQLQTENKELKKALKEYGYHTNACPATSKHILEAIPTNKKCECGLEQCLKGK